MFELFFDNKVKKDLLKIPYNVQKRIFLAIKALTNNPFSRNKNLKKLTGSDIYRIRIGNYRILYHIENKIIFIDGIRHRKDAYKSMP